MKRALLFFVPAFLLAADVNYRGAFVTDADLDRIAAMADVERIDLSLTRVTDLGLLRLKHLRHVRELNLFFAEWITDEGLAVLKDWPKIERLNLRGTKVTDNTLSLLAGKDSIVALDIGFAEVTDSGLQHLTRLKNLRELAFGGNKMTDVGMQVLRSLPNLTDLDIAGRQRTDSGLWSVAVTDFALDPVATLSHLESLNLSGTQITAQGLAKLVPLRKLAKLNLYGAKRIGDDAIPHLASTPALRWVDLADTAVTANGFDLLQQRAPALTVLGRPEASITEPQVVSENAYFRVIRAPGASSEGAGVFVPLAIQPPQHIRVELKQAASEKIRYNDASPTAADGFSRVVLDGPVVRITRIACESRRPCPANQLAAVDIRLNGEARQIGETLFLAPGASARYNEAPQPLELTRIEWKK
ncbi:MAG: hypothetical protein FJW20_19110 [Acidimicrobiia bacterium]|nr:hypothetical protein [Acidimicrobiia bacterium]